MEAQRAREETRDLKLVELRKLVKMASLGGHSPRDRAGSFDPARNIRVVPPFQEKEVDKYFAHFEKVADSLSWSKGRGVLLLQSVMVGKAQETYGSL